MFFNINSTVATLTIILGLIANAAGIGGGILTMVRGPQAFSANEQSDNFMVELINAFTAFIRALAAAPVWIALNAIGFILIGLGIYVLNINSNISC